MAGLNKGIFTISLDFEIHWGVSDHRTIESYRENLENVPKVVDSLLNLFTEYGIHATWATVGMLFCKNKADLLSQVAERDTPQYVNEKLSNYRLFAEVGEDEKSDPFHYASSLIEKIRHTPHQELGTHTFSHYYCLERGQTAETFNADIAAAVKIAKKEGIVIKSIIFPRNQYSDNYLDICAAHGIKAYRGNEKHWIYETRSRENETKIRRGLRLIDTYINISGKNTHTLEVSNNSILNIPSSRFLRPFSSKLSFLDGLRLSRIKKEMTFAAKNNQLYHLWWHPHNFGKNVEKNLSFLKEVLHHYAFLQNKYGMCSLNMGEISDTISLTKEAKIHA